MKRLHILSEALLASAMLAGCAAPVALFDGAALQGWEIATTPAATLASVVSARPDGVWAVAGRPSGYFATKASYTNYRLHAEWRWSAQPGNSGLLLHIASGPKDGVWPESIQVQTKHQFAGDLLPMAGASFAEPLTSAPGAKPQIKAMLTAPSEKPAGEWNSCDVVSQDGRLEVRINGVLQNVVTKAQPSSGRIGFQLEGAPFELRNMHIVALD